MRRGVSNSLMASRIGRTLEKSLRRAYGSFAVKPERYLRELRHAHGLPLQSFGDAFQIHPAALDHVAARTIAGTRRLAIVEGASFGLGGILTLLPDVSILGIITFRLIQKLGLIYGFEFSTEEERAELWLAAASAAGVEAGRDWVKKQVIEKLATRIAEKAGTELAEKLAAGIVPIVSAGLGGTLNAYFINGWGRRAHTYFRDKHLEWRDRPAILTEGVTPLLKE